MSSTLNDFGLRMLNIMSTLRQRAIEAREAANLTQQDLARKIGRSKAAISLIESGATLELKSSTAAGYERATGVRAKWLTTGLPPKMVADAAATADEKPDDLASIEIIAKKIGPEQRADLLKYAKYLEYLEKQQGKLNRKNQSATRKKHEGQPA